MELTDEQLERVIGGMSQKTFQEYRVRVINEMSSEDNNCEPDDSDGLRPFSGSWDSISGWRLPPGVSGKGK